MPFNKNFGEQRGSKLEESFQKKARNAAQEMAEKSQAAGEESKKIIKTTAKIGLGCIVAFVVAIVLLIIFIISLFF